MHRGYRALVCAVVEQAVKSLPAKATEAWFMTPSESAWWLEAAGLDYDATIDALTRQGKLGCRDAA